MASLYNSTQKMPIPSDDVEKGIDSQEKDEEGETQDLHKRTGVSVTRSFITVAILTYINLVITMASSTAVGARSYRQADFKIDYNGSSRKKLVFTVSNIMFGLVFGYLGDRWSRKRIACTGMAVWSAISISMIFVPKEYFPVFLLMNGLLGAAQASFRVTAPSIIADLFVGDRRSGAHSYYNIAAHIGSGLGYIIGSYVTSAASGDSRWALLISPALCLIGLLLMCVSGKEPTRGAAEGNNSKPLSSRTWISDVKQLSKNRSFVFSTLAMTTVKVATGVIGSYTLIFLHCARDIIQESARNPQTEVGSDYDSLIFGLISCISGILGVVVGAKIAKLYKKYKPCAVPIVYACGLHGSAIFLFFALFMGNISLVATYVFIFIGLMCLNLTYFVSADIRLDVASPASRSTAKAISMIVTDLLGKVGSSYFFGLIYECIKSYCPDTVLWKFQSLQCVLMACSSVVAIAGGCFFACACFIEKDHKTAETESEDLVLDVTVTTP